jgi:hypothetical protein
VVLGRLLAALGLQLVLRAEPLWEKIDADIAGAQGRSVDEVFAEAADNFLCDGFKLPEIEETLGDIPRRYCGLTAAVLLGAPLPLRDCELMLCRDEPTLAAFHGWLMAQDASRWDDRLQAFGGVPRDPREPGTPRWRTFLGLVAVTWVERLPPAVSVSLGGRELPVVGLTDIETDDPYGKRVLERMRMPLASQA